MIQLYCPVCEKLLDLPDRLASGQKLQCPVCQNKFQHLTDFCIPFGKEMECGTPGNRRFACPKCGQHYEISGAPRFPYVSCHGCGHIFAVPHSKKEAHPSPQIPENLLKIIGDDVPMQRAVNAKLQMGSGKISPLNPIRREEEDEEERKLLESNEDEQLKSIALKSPLPLFQQAGRVPEKAEMQLDPEPGNEENTDSEDVVTTLTEAKFPVPKVCRPELPKTRKSSEAVIPRWQLYAAIPILIVLLVAVFLLGNRLMAKHLHILPQQSTEAPAK